MPSPDIKQNIEAKQELQLRLTPSLIQTVEILQMPVQELLDYIEQEVTQNPFLEIGESEFQSIDNIKGDLSSDILTELDEEQGRFRKVEEDDQENPPIWETLKDETQDI